MIAWLKSFGVIINRKYANIWMNYMALRNSFKQICLFQCKLSATNGVPNSPEKKKLIQISKKNISALRSGITKKIAYLKRQGKSIPKGQEKI
jgi:hypothetical protein